MVSYRCHMNKQKEPLINIMQLNDLQPANKDIKCKDISDIVK